MKHRETLGDAAVDIGGIESDFMVFGVGLESATTFANEGERPVELFAGEGSVSVGGGDFAVEIVGGEAATNCARDHVLREHVERFVGCEAWFDAACKCGVACGGNLNKFEGVSRHARDSACSAGTMAGAACALQEATDAFG